jgi:threonine aldolase
VHEPISSLVTIENTINASGGLPLDVAYTERVAAVAHERGLPVHLDGARLFNAVVALGVPAADLCAPVDSVMVALSKGLACPVGSVVAGDHAFIHRARRARKILGGGMRQAGIIAAAGVFALQDGPAGMISRLAEDHATARRLGEGLARFEFLDVDLSRVQTNFVMFRVRGSEAGWRARRAAFVKALWDRGVLTFAHVGESIRAVTHYGITDDDIDHALSVVPEAWKAVQPVFATA